MKQIDHFIRLAKRGKHPAASGGEGRAWRLANALLNDLNGMDDDALMGLLAFLELVVKEPEKARTLVDAWE